MSKKYADVAQFLLVYIREAHPTGDWPVRVSSTIGTIDDPTSMMERRAVAESCVTDLHVDIPTVIDNMQDSIAKDYKSHPDRLYVVGKDGKIAYRSGPGPRGFKPDLMEAALIEELNKIGVTAPVANGD